MTKNKNVKSVIVFKKVGLLTIKFDDGTFLDLHATITNKKLRDNHVIDVYTSKKEVQK